MGVKRERNGMSKSPSALRLTLLVGAAAIVVRLAFVLETRAVVFVREPVGDARAYHEWAQRIAAGNWLGDETFYQAPLYPYVVAIGIAAFGDGVGVIRVAQCCAGALSAILLFLAARRMFGGRVGALAGLMLAFYAPAIFFDGIIQKASLGCLLTCAMLALAARPREARSLRTFALLGLVLGLLCITRENAIVWVVVLAVWLAIARVVPAGGARCGAVVAFVLGVFAILAPVALRNAIVGGEWSVSTFQAGPNFYIGNRMGASGRYEPLVRGRETPAFERTDATLLAEKATGCELSAREVSRYWMGRTWDDIRSAPGAWLALLGHKLVMVWNRYEIADAESAVVYADGSLILRTLRVIWHFGVLCPLAALGVAMTWSRRGEFCIHYVLIASMAVAVALFFVMARYRYPLVPLLIPFAAAGCVHACDRLRADGPGSLGKPLAVAALVALAVNLPVHDERRLDALAWMNAGVAHARLGELHEAKRYFRRALEEHSGSAEAHNNLAQAFAITGDYTGAIIHYQTALSLEPELVGAEYNLGVALEHAGRREEALAHFRRAVELDPSDSDAAAAVRRLGP